MSTISIYLNQRNFAVVALLVLMSNLIIGGVLLPYRQAQAVFSLFPIQVTQWIQEVVADAYQIMWEAYDSAGTWITAAIKWWEKADNIYMKALKAAWMILRKRLLNMLVDDIIKWIRGGGKPRLVTDWQGFLKDAANKAGGQFVDKYLGMGFLCQRFDARLKFALAAVPTFDTAAACTLDQIGTNIDNFLNNFSTGGWKGWITVNETQNNIYGAYLMALDKKIGIQAEAEKAAQNEGVASSGFLGDKRCTSIYERANPGNIGDYTAAPLKEEEIPAGWVCSNWTTYTPGKIAAEATAKAVNLDIDWLISAKEFTEYMGAIIDAVINRAIKEGIAYATADSSFSGGSAGQTGPGISTPATAANANINLSPYQDAIKNNDVAPALTQQMSLLSDNYNGYLGQLQNSLSVLAQISSTQITSLGILQQLVENDCPLPAGVNKTLTDTQTAGNCNAVCPCDQNTVETFQINAPGTGSLTMQKTTTEIRGNLLYADPDATPLCPPLAVPEPPVCVTPAICSTIASYQTLSSVPAGVPEITNVTNEITNAQNKINQLSTATGDIQNYQQAATWYINLYEAVQRGTSATTQLELNSAEEAMFVAKDQAVASMQAITGSPSSDFQMLLQEIQNASLQVVQENNDAQMKRGIISDCGYVQPGTYYADLCAAQATQQSYQTALTACQQNNGGNGE